MTERRSTTPVNAFWLKCNNCSSGSLNEVQLCPVRRYPLWTRRIGCWPKTEGKKYLWATVDPDCKPGGEA